MTASILLLDDEAKFCQTLARLLQREGHDAHAVSDPHQALELLKQRPFDLLLTDLRMPGLSGLEVLGQAKQLCPSMDVVMVTAYATPETAVEAMKLGAIDYLIKPCGVDAVKRIIETAQNTRHLSADDSDSTDSSGPATSSRLAPVSKSRISRSSPTQNSGMVHRRQQVNEPVAASSIMKELFSKALKVASRESSVLITGESGTGKEVLARYIHAHSSRSAKPMVVVNCGAIPESLIESELFGHVRGAFTGAIDSRVGYFEAAHQGTLFLDEIGELPLALQVKLLRALQDGCIQRVGDSKQTHVDVRVLVATHRNLEEAVSRGAFRQDLYFRLNVIPLSIPPLRQRPEDIRAMAEVFLNRYSPGHPLQLSQDAWDALLSYGYPGNVRELENAIEHACVLAEGPNIELGDLPERIQKQSPVSDFSPGAYPPVSQPAESSPLLTPAPGSCRTSPATLEAIEKKMISEALERARFNHTRAAGLLGITRRTLGYRIRKHGLDEFVDQGVAREREARRTLNDLT